MSLQDAINTGNPPALDWTNVRFKSLAIDQKIYDSTNNQGTANQVLSKSAGNALVWAAVNPVPILGDINNFTIYQTSTVAPPTTVATNTTQRIDFSSFFDNSAAAALFSWRIAPNNYIGFNITGAFDAFVEISMIYPASSSGRFIVSLTSNVPDLNNRQYHKIFNNPIAADTLETIQIGFIIDQRVAPTPIVSVFITNDAFSSDPIQFSNSGATGSCKFAATLLRT